MCSVEHTTPHQEQGPVGPALMSYRQLPGADSAEAAGAFFAAASLGRLLPANCPGGLAKGKPAPARNGARRRSK